MSSIFENPFKTTNLNITNEQYENYEAKELITSELPQFSKFLRQWKTHLNQGFFKEVFVKQIAYRVTELIISGLIGNEGVSILGALYIEKVIRGYKQFILFLLSGSSEDEGLHQVDVCSKMI